MFGETQSPPPPIPPQTYPQLFWTVFFCGWLSDCNREVFFFFKPVSKVWSNRLFILPPAPWLSFKLSAKMVLLPVRVFLGDIVVHNWTSKLFTDVRGGEGGAEIAWSCLDYQDMYGCDATNGSVWTRAIIPNKREFGNYHSAHSTTTTTTVRQQHQ